ncbi:NUDIX domain-containing protein [Actinopolymorpha pittospori]|uniref:ADP-ribose pyrophosphatase YjhB (NUDIX family) n=1 Tax=Actinopolymorpha pittospori TaxID=648752 RepID=A0A927MUL5_9ACTN|nr:NUDIX hydrolase [Actinopolymorpha pittospori]MBE1606924.1 ADP-ribose pyrophosphatase YjhB (NUDIX family) [Actinopolymorpha pittospori]
MTGVSVDLDLQAEGEPEKEFHPGIASRLPRKRTAGGTLIRDQAGRIFFVDPTYKPTLEIPGGIAEENESPWDACRREVNEEIGLDLATGALLIVDWIPAHGIWGDGLMFIFDGGVLDSDQAQGLSARDGEVRDLEFLTIDEASPRLRPSMVRRLISAVDALHAGPTYAHFGRAVL